MPYVLYVAVKLISYIAWCWVGLRLWRAGSTSLLSAAGFGILRLAIGVAFGVAIFLVVPTQPEDVIWKYVVIYTPVRVREGFIMALIIGGASENQNILHSVFVCLGGIVVFSPPDFAPPQAVDAHLSSRRSLSL